MRRMIRPVLLAACGLALTACSVSVSVGPEASKTDVERAITDALDSIGQHPDSVTCPGSLPAVVGKSARCELTSGKMRIGVTATITEVDGSTAKYHVKVDDKPMQ